MLMVIFILYVYVSLIHSVINDGTDAFGDKAIYPSTVAEVQTFVPRDTNGLESAVYLC